MMQNNYKQEFIRFLLDTGALRFGDFPHKNGGTIPYDINAAALKTGMQIATLGKFYAKCYLDKIGRRQTVLYGPAYKGIPIAISTSFALSANDLDIPFFFNRKESKDHGEGGTFVGYLPQEKEDIVIVEDIITFGKTLRESVSLVNALPNVKIGGAIITVDSMEKGTDDRTFNEDIAKELGFPIYAIVSIHDIIAYAEANPRCITPAALNALKDYVKENCIKRRF